MKENNYLVLNWYSFYSVSKMLKYEKVMFAIDQSVGALYIVFYF